jgi:DNA-binding response OmpR family regulator
MSRRVLVVDDDDLTRDIVATILDLEEYEVETAPDGRAGLAVLRERRPDVIVLDVMMPGIDGFEVCKRIKGDPETAEIPVILLTARDTVEDRRLGEEAGCDAYLTKPFSPLALIERIGAFEAARGRTGEGRA